MVVYSYLLVLASVSLLLYATYRSRSSYRDQVLPIVVGTLAPLASNVAFHLTEPNFDLAPLAFSITGAAFGWAVLRHGFLELRPVARDRLIEEMDDPVLVVDEVGHVVDYNPAVTRLRGVDDPLGGDVEHVLGMSILDRTETDGGWDEAVVVDTVEGERYVDPEVTPLGTATTPSGSLIVLRDVTDLKRRERDLARLQDVTSRFLRHNLRNDLSVVSGYANTIAERTDGETQTYARDIAATADDVIEKSTKTQVVERVIDQGHQRRPVEVTTIVTGCLRDVRSTFPDVRIETDMPEVAWASASPFLTTAIRNVVENAAEHCDADRPAVTLRVQSDAAHVRLSVSDNGAGVPSNEVEVVKRGHESDLNHGSGIGLYLVDWIVEKSGGTLSFEDDNATVVVTLPATTPP
ncbi:histidine kinase N-terminal 7TM domain-containing protein [Haloarculaceae archaeon H-GB2-1]|nr:histidine kinase N-terminal 7TM domain-containing protein [Haloarculaceae archaeon H-GB11]MEA5408849.1 histidine kinase N-terminal 7TM domain-containing protein [Haloarculaceae archaeon H-GB2-1]